MTKALDEYCTTTDCEQQPQQQEQEQTYLYLRGHVCYKLYKILKIQ